MIIDTEIGKPCYFGTSVVRIVKHVEGAATVVLDGREVVSRVLICTPHGTSVETGISHLGDIDVPGVMRLGEYEDNAFKSGKLYGGLYTPENFIDKKNNNE